MLRTLTKIKGIIAKLPRRTIFFCLLSAIFIILSFPKYDIFPLCWVALIPLLFAIEGCTWRQAFARGYFTGIVVYCGTLTWFINMAATAEIPLPLAVAALIGMAIYLSVYYGLFGAGIVLLAERKWHFRVFMCPAMWVILEFARDHLFSGFGWLSLGYSQYKFLSLIQIADITGVMGVSFLLVLTNVILKESLGAYFKKETPRYFNAVILLTVVLLAAVIFYGRAKLSVQPREEEMIEVAVVQGNIDQNKKWRPWHWPEIINKYFALTEAAAASKPDLIIWPETSFPGYLWDYPPGMFADIQRFVREHKIPLLFGAVLREGEEYFNTAVLLDETGEVVTRYDKLHLVPFGEFLPLRNVFPILKELIPIADFTNGEIATQFPVVAKKGSREHSNHFSVLICFEDTVARLARRLVNAGAGLLVNITNDAWFLDSKEPHLHLQGAVFRAVENRRDIIRAANTGISCFISRKGEIHAVLKDAEDDPTYVEGHITSSAAFYRRKTFYTQYGDVFVFICFSFFILNMIFLKE
ncbi:MAG: apolipoprotein N-acyltransferase [Candidatus Omnitrophica bacterium]|nr:apolipoprotein N-acyltransferase [Candidatus Omnitrophota bacterium]